MQQTVRLLVFLAVLSILPVALADAGRVDAERSRSEATGLRGLGGEAMHLVLHENGGTVLSWDTVPGAVGYDVLVSATPSLSQGVQFLARDVAGVSSTDVIPAGPGALRSYLVRAVFQGGEVGPWGVGSNGRPRLGDDRDGDGVADGFDVCPGVFNPNQVDMDLDGVGDICDNCPTEFNPDQQDANADGGGDVCEPSPVIALCDEPFVPERGIAEELFDQGLPDPRLEGRVHPVVQFSSALMDGHQQVLNALGVGFDPIDFNLFFAAIRQDQLQELGQLPFVRAVFPFPEQCKAGEAIGCAQLTHGRWTQRDVNSPAPRTRLALSQDPDRGRAVLFGGGDLQGPPLLGDTWEWDGQSWHPFQPFPVPPARADHAMAHAGDGRTLLFGGLAADPDTGGAFESNDTWLWDGVKWEVAFPSDPPSPRRQHALAYDALRRQVVLFGGQDAAGNLLADTWIYEDGEWRQVAEDGPSPRRDHAMAYDEEADRIVLFGGTDGNDLFDDTWLWDGEAWTEADPATRPTRRFGHAMAGRAPECGVLMNGGSPGGEVFGDTWFWNGDDWAKVAVPREPEAAFDHGMAWDGDRRRGVIFGGQGVQGQRLGSTWELEPSQNMEVRFHQDVPLGVAGAILGEHDAIVLQPGVVIGGAQVVNSWQAAVPDSEIAPLSARDPVIHVQFAQPSTDTNDGARVAIGVNVAQGAPWCGGGGCSGVGITIGQWESRWAAGDAGGPAPLPGGNGTHAALVGRTLVRDRPGGTVGPAPPAGCAASIVCGLCTYSNHATHVAGTILGDGTGNFNQRGMAPSPTTQIISYDSQLTMPVATQTCEMQDSQTAFGARLGSVSWGSLDSAATQALYDGFSIGYDQQISANPGQTMFFAAANSQRTRGLAPTALPPIYNAPSAGGTCTPPPPGIAGPPAIAEPSSIERNRFFTLSPGRGSNAKNTLTIGAINSGGPSAPGGLGRMTTFSSWGPTRDGRIKPDLVAPGAENNTEDGGVGDPDPTITSTNCAPNSGNCGTVNMGYGGLRGTSMATPAAAGGAALVLEHQAAVGAAAGDPQLDSDSLRALLIHTATDLQTHFPVGGAFMTRQDCDGDGSNDDCWPVPAVVPGSVQDGPDYVNGWGLVNIPAALQKVTSRNPAVTLRPSGCPSSLTYAQLPFNSPLAAGGDPASIGIAGCVDGSGNPLTSIWDWVGYVTVPAGTTELRVTIAWDDPPPAAPPAAASTAPVLVNDLDLIVTPFSGVGGTPTGPHNYTWWLDPACPYLEAVPVSSATWSPATYSDQRNTVEQVVIPAPAEGVYRIVVQAIGLASPQPFGIAISMPPTVP